MEILKLIFSAIILTVAISLTIKGSVELITKIISGKKEVGGWAITWAGISWGLFYFLTKI